MIVAIDGPAGVGKSTVARELARRLGFRYLDTGAMYRAATLSALRAGVDLGDADALADLVSSIRIELAEPAPGAEHARVLLDGEDVSEEIRGTEVDRSVSFVASKSRVRKRLSEQQRRVASEADFVCEGRDMGTVVFPDAPVKVYLDADPNERARRRAEQIARKSAKASPGGSEPGRDQEQILREIMERDRLDSERKVAPLRPARDAVVLDTTEQSVESVLEKVETIVREQLEARGDATT